MLIIFGWGRRTVRVLGWAPSQVCGHCHNEGPWAVALIRRWFTLFFIPVIPYESRYVAMCPVCSHGVDLDRGKASHLIQGSRELPSGEGPTASAKPRQEAVAGRARPASARRRGYAILAVVGVIVVLLVAMAMIVSDKNGSSGRSETQSIAPGPTATSSSNTLYATTYRDDAHHYSLTYDSANMSPITSASTLNSVRSLLPGGAVLGLALQQKHSTSTSPVVVLVTGYEPLGDYTYLHYLKDLPGMLPLYALYFRGKSGSGTVSSKIEAVGTRKALNYQYSIPAPGGGWYWGNATMVLTPRGWVDVMIVGSGKHPGRQAQPFLETARSLEP